ncbi:type IV pilus modification protein PilV [uncultured Nitrosomonas sp.]|uniref:type IV pilus modification protein PilV n=1 Tax=uncultured Nitrosomonas sp. TaxID=156424 RepID=UPI002607A422|nr:type IV pilus modification protein PilV [uncultured Nitrosomonas sp.]
MLNKPKNHSFVYGQAGVSMIEVLVSIIILSIGLLGLAGLQTASLTQNHSANFRSTATVMAYSILDSMRANRIEAGAGSYNHALEDSIPASGTDVGNWLNELALRLPEGSGSINVDANNRVTVLIQWDDSRGAAAAQQFAMTTRL